MERTKIAGVRKKTYTKRTFSKEQLEDAENLVGMYGARNKELALYFDVAENTIDYWLKNYPDFERAVKRGRVHIGLKVAKALVAKAIGYSHPDVHILTNIVKTYDDEGKVIESHTEPLLVPIMKHYPPDAYAANKYLAIMFREMWSESAELNINHKHSGEITHRAIQDIDMKELSTEEQDFIFNLNRKQLKQIGEN